MTLPSSFRAAMGVGEGSMVELSLKNGKTLITPKVAIDRTQFPNADDEYTPAQRRVVDARLKDADEDIKAKRTYGPFASHEEMMTFLEKEVQPRGTPKANRKKK